LYATMEHCEVNLKRHSELFTGIFGLQMVVVTIGTL